LTDAPRPIRILVVDDSAFARKVVREVLEADPRFQVVDIARDGLDALEKIARFEPDVVTLDLVMPNLDGLGVLDALSSLAVAKPPRVILVSMSEGDSSLVVLALQKGAIDVVHKPTALATDRLFELGDDLRSKVLSAAAATVVRGAPRPLARLTAPPLRETRRRLVLIGASTGGPQALTRLLGAFPRDFPLPIGVALHMPVGYTAALAKRLDESCALEVVEAYDGVELVPGRAVIARAGMHLKIERGDPPRGRLDFVPADKPHHPSVDVLLESAAVSLGSSCVAAILTGMGEDGLIGARALRAARSVVLTEAESSCVVYGMPRAVEIAGLSDGVFSLDRMAEAIVRRV
jgi:two-component system, chemotaxis family, protein-glutamate methylesterase/glutaminase